MDSKISVTFVVMLIVALLIITASVLSFAKFEKKKVSENFVFEDPLHTTSLR